MANVKTSIFFQAVQGDSIAKLNLEVKKIIAGQHWSEITFHPVAVAQDAYISSRMIYATAVSGKVFLP